MGSVKPIAGNMAMVAVACSLAYGSRHAIRHVAGVSQEMLANAVVAQVGLGSLVAMKAVQQKSALDQRVAEVSRLTEEREGERRRADGLQGQLTTATGERDRFQGEAGQAAGLRGQLSQTERDLAEVRQEAATAQGAVRVKEDELQGLRAEKGRLSAELQTARGESRALADRAGRVAGLEQELARVTRALEEAEGQREEHLGELQSSWESEYGRLEERHARSMEALATEHQQEIALLQGTHQEGRGALERQHQEALSEAQRSLREELEAGHQQAVELLNQEHQRALDALREQYQQGIAAQQIVQPAAPPPPPPMEAAPSVGWSRSSQASGSSGRPPQPDLLGALAEHQFSGQGVAPRAPEDFPNLAPNDALKQEIVRGIQLKAVQAGSSTQAWVTRPPDISDPSNVGACIHSALSSKFAAVNRREDEVRGTMTLADLTDKLQWEEVENAAGEMVQVPNAVITYLDNMSVADARSLMGWVNRHDVDDDEAMKPIYQYIVNVTVVLYQASKSKVDMTASILSFGAPGAVPLAESMEQFMTLFQSE